MISISDNGRIIIDDEESNFLIQEFVPKTVWDEFYSASIWFVQPVTIRLAQFYRDWFDAPLFINNWHVGGQYNLRGYRSGEVGLLKELRRQDFQQNDVEKVKEILLKHPQFDAEMLSLGSWESKHKMGIAFDSTVQGLSANDMRYEILDHEDEFMQAGLTTLEGEQYAPTWCHSDARITGKNFIFIVKPN